MVLSPGFEPLAFAVPPAARTAKTGETPETPALLKDSPASEAAVPLQPGGSSDTEVVDVASSDDDADRGQGEKDQPQQPPAKKFRTQTI